MTYLLIGTNSQNASFRNEDLALCDKEPCDPGPSWKAEASFHCSWTAAYCALPHPAGPPALWALMLSLSFLHLPFFSSLLSLVNLVREKQKVHFLLT